jgi:hypothetical protein
VGNDFRDHATSGNLTPAASDPGDDASDDRSKRTLTPSERSYGSFKRYYSPQPEHPSEEPSFEPRSNSISCNDMDADTIDHELRHIKIQDRFNASLPLPPATHSEGAATDDPIDFTDDNSPEGDVSADTVSDTQCSTDDNEPSSADETTATPWSIAKKRELVDRIMSYFYSMFNRNTGIISHARVAAGSSSSQPQSRGGSSGGSGASQLGPAGLKRGAPSGGSEPPDEDAGDSGAGKRPRVESDYFEPDGKGRKFACPYFKRNPPKYHRWRSCPGPGWDSVHRIK